MRGGGCATMIVVKNVKKIFNAYSRNRNEVLKGVSFELPEKGLIAIFGKSGSGKTTLLNIIGGLDKPDSGEILFQGEAVTASKSDAIRNAKVGFVFQNYYLERGFTISEILENAMRIAGFRDQAEIAERRQAVLKLVDMARFANKQGDALSGGQKQRVAIARALIKGADVILADEPTGNLDADNTEKIMGILKEISKTRLVVLVTHELSLIEKYADDYIQMVDGRIVRDEQTQRIVKDSALSHVTVCSGRSQAVATDKQTTVFSKSGSAKTGRLFSCRSILKDRKKESGERFYSTANLFKQIFIAAIAVVVSMLAFRANEMIRLEVENTQIDPAGVYVNMNTYADIRNLDTSYYTEIDFFDTEMREGIFGLSGLASVSSVSAGYTPSAWSDTLKLEVGAQPQDGEVAISRGLAERIKGQIRVPGLDSDTAIVSMMFDHVYRVRGIVASDVPAVYFTRSDYVNFLGVYNAIKFSDINNVLFAPKFAETEFSAIVKVSEEVKSDDKIIVEINRNSLYKMIADPNAGYYAVEEANKAIAYSPYAIQLRDSRLFVQKVAITRESTGADIIILVTENVMKNIFVYLSPNFDALEGGETSSDARYYFEIKTPDLQTKAAVTDYLEQKSIRSIDILQIYEGEEKSLRKETVSGLTVYYVLIVLLLLIYYFIEKSGSIRNVKEYGVYRAIGVNRSNLLYREAMSAVFDNLAMYVLATLLTVAMICVRYFVMNVEFGLFIALAAAMATLCGGMMIVISLIPYFFVIRQTPAKILAKYDI